MSAGNYHISVRQVYETEAKLRVQIYLQLIMRSNKVGNILISQNEIYVNDSMWKVVNDVPHEFNVTVMEDDINDLDESTFPVLSHSMPNHSAHNLTSSDLHQIWHICRSC